MLTIRRAQMDVLAADAETRFREGLVRSAERSYSAPGLRERVEAALDRAARYGIRERHDLLWFIGLDMARGAAWETVPGMEWALDVLDSAGTDVAGRRYRLHKRLKRWDEHEH